MNKTSNLIVRTAGLVTLATLVGTSAFAESRHRDATSDNAPAQTEERRTEPRSNPQPQQQQPRFNPQPQRPVQQQSRPQVSQPANQPAPQQHWAAQPQQPQQPRQATQPQIQQPSQQRWNAQPQQPAQSRWSSRQQNPVNAPEQQPAPQQQQVQQQQNDQRQRDTDRTPHTYNRGGTVQTQRPGWTGGQQQSGHQHEFPSTERRTHDGDRVNIRGTGRVSRINHANGGYRVWLDGGHYSYFVPEARWRQRPISIGWSIGFGGYLDPMGYVDVSDIAWDDEGYGPDASYVSANISGDDAPATAFLRGTVDSVDLLDGKLVLHDDLSGNLVTVALETNDNHFDDVRAGDYIAISGGWTTGGIFQAYDLNEFQPANQ